MRRRPSPGVRRRYPTAAAVAGAGLIAVAAIVMTASAATVSENQPSSDVQSLVAKPKPRAQLPKMLRGTGIIRWGELYQEKAGYERFAYVLVSRPAARSAARLPGTTLVYKSGTDIQKGWSTGVTYQVALANDWLLRDASGAYMMNAQYGSFVADIGNPAYQRRFLESTLAFLKRTKVDGVFIDNVLGDPSSFTGGVYPTKYPNGEAWESAMISFVQSVGKALKARGYYVLANAAKWISGDQRSDTGEHVAAFWRRVAPSVSGLMTEYWVQNPNDHRQLRVLGSSWYEHWRGWQDLVLVAQTLGVDFFGLTYGSRSDTRSMRYARGSFLLDWNGRGGAFVYSITDQADPYHLLWVRQMGAPLRPKLQRASGIWQRRFERGMVVVNATNSPSVLRVFGQTYTVAGADALFVRAPRH